MMQNSAEHAQLWPHSFIILTQGPASTLHEEDRGQKWKQNNKKQKKCLQTVDRRAGRVLIHMYIPFINMI